MDWTDAYNQMICELMAQQVTKGNRPNTHLNTLGYTKVSTMFFQMTGIELTKTQLKNKWDRLKGEWTTWQNLVRRQTRIGWDNTKGVIVMDKEWWKKAKLVSVVSSKNYRMVMFHFVSSYCSYDV
jgi:hypothetical protein